MGNVSSPTDEWTPLPLDIPPHWEQIDFENAFENISLSHLKIPQKEYLSSGTIPIVDQGANLIGGFTNDASRSIRPNRALIVFGDHTKCFKLVGFRFAPGADGVKVLRPITINERFAYYACRALRLPDRGYSRHYAFLKKSKLPLAPQNEQHLIVAKIEELFSELDKGVESLKATRAKLNIYRQAVLKHAFEGKLTAHWREENKDKLETPEQLLARIKQEREARYEQQLQEWKAAVKKWEKGGKSGKRPARSRMPKSVSTMAEEEIAHLESLPSGWLWLTAESVGIVQLGRQRSPKNRSKDYPTKYIRAANITEQGLDLDDVLDMDFLPHELSAYRLEKGDLVLSEASGSAAQVGKPAIWDDQIPNCCFQNTVIRHQPYCRDYAAYLLWLYRFFYVSGKFAQVAGGVGINHLSAFKFAQIALPLCSLAEQQGIVRLLEERFAEIEHQEREIVSALNQAEMLRQSILKNAFSGQLVPQDPDDEPASILLERIKAEKAAQSQNNTRAKRRRTTATA